VTIFDGMTAEERKKFPLAVGCLDYFGDAMALVARVSAEGSRQHHPDEPTGERGECHWARGKSADHADALLRHLYCRGSLDGDGLPHTAKAAWRALAILQEELEQQRGLAISRGSR
jgi:hypothetical protein